MMSEIWVIDDDLVVHFGCKHTFKEINTSISYQLFDDPVKGFQALLERQELEQEMPKLILLDINMPRMDGWMFLRDLKEKGIDPASLNIQMFSSSISLNDKEKSISLGAKNLISKPLTKEILLKLLSQ